MIGTLPCLQSLTIDMTAWNYHDYQTLNTIEGHEIISILKPLVLTNAKNTELEINVEVPEPMRTILQSLNFTIKHHQRPYNSEVFRQG
jgi:hypothetical protein